MFLFLPFKAKNPPEHVPYATYSLIGLNTLVYLCTSNGLEIRESAMRALAVSDATFSVWRIFTAMFLHADIFHIAGNMLFLWIFGAPLEGRLRPLKYIALYLTAGVCGTLLDEVVVGMFHSERFALGASGAIMGLAGAYMWVFPHSIIRIFRIIWLFFFYRRFGITEWKAQWVVMYYVGLDIVKSILFQGADGVGHFAHIGGALAGFLIVLALRTPRDDEFYSQAQASRASTKDVRELNEYDLEAFVNSPNPTPALVMAFCEKKSAKAHPMDAQKCVDALKAHGRLLMESGDPFVLNTVVMRLPTETLKSLPTVFLLRLGTRLERLGAADPATHLYYRVLELCADTPDCEAALFRLGRLAETVYGDASMAANFYSEQMRRFPAGALSADGRTALNRLVGPVPAPRPAVLQARPVSSGAAPAARPVSSGAAPAARPVARPDAAAPRP